MGCGSLSGLKASPGAQAYTGERRHKMRDVAKDFKLDVEVAPPLSAVKLIWHMYDSQARLWPQTTAG